jgi:hypothetical protein
MAEGLSLCALRREREEIQKDWTCFMEMYDLLRGRILESNELQPPRAPMFHQWSGTHAVCGSLEMTLHAVERTRDELDQYIRQVESGTILNVDPPARPRLSLVEDEEMKTP